MYVTSSINLVMVYHSSMNGVAIELRFLAPLQLMGELGKHLAHPHQQIVSLVFDSKPNYYQYQQ